MSESYSLLPATDQEHKHIPRTKGLPLIGSLPGLLKDPFGFLVRARETYGDIYILNLGVAKMLVCNHPRHAQHMLVDNLKNYPKDGAMWDSIRTLMGNGLLVSDGDFWRRQRRMIQPHFHRQRLTGLSDAMVGAIDDALATWPAGATVTPLSMIPACSHITMKVILRTMLGGTLTQHEMNQVGESIGFIMDYMLVATLTNNLPGWMPIPGRKRYQHALDTFNQAIYRIIETCRQGKDQDNHLLAMLVDSVDDETGERMSDQQLRDEVTTLFLGGYETTSIALAWALYYLAQHPDLNRKLQEEVNRVLGNRLPGFADLAQLDYTRRFVQETLRLRPPSWWTPRVAAEDDEIDGYDIPAGTMVVALTYMIHRHPQEWPDPERFDPDRFLPEPSAERHKYAWVPFGGGQRMCIGRDFGIMEATLALAMIIQRFQVSPVPGRTAQLKLSTGLQTKDGIHVNVTKRA